MQKIYTPAGDELTVINTEDRNGETYYIVKEMGNYPMSQSMFNYLNLSFEKPTEDKKANSTLAHALVNKIYETGLNDNGFDLCNDLFKCMNEQEQENFLNTYGYDDLGYAYDDDRDLPQTLIHNMGMESLKKVEFLLKRYEVEE